MEIQYKLNIQGTTYDLVPNYPQENRVDLEALNEVCFMLHQDQEMNSQTDSSSLMISQLDRECVERLLRRKQDFIIDSIHRGCYPKMLNKANKYEEILLQYLMNGKSLSLSQENREKILHFYTLVDSDIKGTLFSPYGAIFLSDDKISEPLARILFEKQLSEKTELKTPLLSGRMLIFMRDEYSDSIKNDILSTYSEAELLETTQKFTAFFRGVAFCKCLDKQEQLYLENDPFYLEYQEAKKIASSNSSCLLRRTARAMYFFESEMKKREEVQDNVSIKKK